MRPWTACALALGLLACERPQDMLAPKPDGQGFYGTSMGSYGEPDYPDVPHPLQICAGPPDTPLGTPVAELTCADTDRKGRYALSVPAGSYRVLFAERGEASTSDRQRCLYPVKEGQNIKIDRVTGRGAPRGPAPCAAGSSADPITAAELASAVRGLDMPRPISSTIRRELVSLVRQRVSAGTSVEQLADELQIDVERVLRIVGEELSYDPTVRAAIPPLILVDEQRVAHPREHAPNDRVRLIGMGFLDEPGKVTLRALDRDESFAIERMTWTSSEVSFAIAEELPGGRYVVSVRRPDGLESHPRDAVVEIPERAPPESEPEPAPPEPTGAPEGPPTLTTVELEAGIEVIKPAAIACGSQHAAAPGTEVRIKMIVAGATGEVTTAEPAPGQSKDPLSECVAAAAKAASFPKFRKAQLAFTYTFRM